VFGINVWVVNDRDSVRFYAKLEKICKLDCRVRLRIEIGFVNKVRSSSVRVMV